MTFINSFVVALFLYFPEDKSEYLPAFITSLIFLVGAVLTTIFIIRYSKKEALKTKKLEEEILKNNENEQHSIN
ncbi:hypothetical protein D0469_08250 [Peribacillus saganii]|uniref:Uncharacterized protein n=1 Tax=Peribacillus saganii TaxID=2303992 RepID=A0A372LR58_9BACI|nr:hypothetical protein [Peribacillus saganii]RFU70163.1 hypothetical protein D0469_08250 [Peribacillus saganii]